MLALALLVPVMAVSAGVPEAGAQAGPAVDGSWRATLTAPDGRQFRLLFQFRSEDRIVTGTVAVNDSPAVPIQDGRLRGAENDFLVFVRESVDDRDDKLLFGGRVTREEIRFSLTRITLPNMTTTVKFTATRIQ
jgi:hypothetical protein